MQAPTCASSCSSPTILADIFRVGEVNAMVDTGAYNSVVTESLVHNRSAFDVRVSPSTWRSVDGRAIPVVGEVSLSVRYHGQVVDLNQVVVVKEAIYPVVLGMDWIRATGLVYRDGRMVVSVQQPEMETLCHVAEDITGEKPEETDAEKEPQTPLEGVHNLGLMVVDDGDKDTKLKRQPNVFLKPRKSQIIPEAHFGFISTKAPDGGTGL